MASGGLNSPSRIPANIREGSAQPLCLPTRGPAAFERRPRSFADEAHPTLEEVAYFGRCIENDFLEANCHLTIAGYKPISQDGVTPFSFSPESLQELYARGYDILRYMLLLAIDNGRQDCIFLAISPVTDQGSGFVRRQLHLTELYVLDNGSSLDLCPNEKIFCTKFNHFGHHAFAVVGDYDFDRAGKPVKHSLHFDPHDGARRYLVRARYGRRSVNCFGTITYGLPFNKDTGSVDVTVTGGFYFAGFWSFDDLIKHNLHDDIVGGVDLLGNFRRASGMVGGRFPDASFSDVRYCNFGYPDEFYEPPYAADWN